MFWHDRALALENEKDERLFAHVAGQAEVGRFEVELAATPGRRKRKAQPAVR